MKVLWWYVRNSALYSSQAIKEMTEAKVVTWKSPVSKAVGITDEVTMANAVFPTRSQNRRRCICFWKFIWQTHAEHQLCSARRSKVFYVNQLFRSAQQSNEQDTIIIFILQLGKMKHRSHTPKEVIEGCLADWVSRVFSPRSRGCRGEVMSSSRMSGIELTFKKNEKLKNF